MTEPKVLAINSLPAYGHAGLKMVMSVLGTRVIPVPSLLLSGIGNIHGHQRYAVPFADLLNQTLQLIRQQETWVILYIGYLGDSGQIPVICQAIEDFRDSIHYILVDPVCGDNGKSYVPESIIQSWPSLLALADMAVPNLTEVALLSGFRPPIALDDAAKYLTAFRSQYPALWCIVTGMPENGKVANQLLGAELQAAVSYNQVPGYFSGTGDAFASLFLLYHCFQHLPAEEALSAAGRAMADLLQYSSAVGSTDLLLHPSLTSYCITHG